VRLGEEVMRYCQADSWRVIRRRLFVCEGSSVVWDLECVYLRCSVWYVAGNE
jgi:hypothetical protein